MGALLFEHPLRKHHELALLRQRLAQFGEKGLVIPHADHVGAGLGARGEAGLVFLAVTLERRELVLHLLQVALRDAHTLGPFALGLRRGLLHDVEPFGAFHEPALLAGAAANSCRREFTASACPTRCSMPCVRNFCIAGHSSMAASIRGSLPFW